MAGRSRNDKDAIGELGRSRRGLARSDKIRLGGQGAARQGMAWPGGFGRSVSVCKVKAVVARHGRIGCGEAVTDRQGTVRNGQPVNQSLMSEFYVLDRIRNQTPA